MIKMTDPICLLDSSSDDDDDLVILPKPKKQKIIPAAASYKKPSAVFDSDDDSDDIPTDSIFSTSITRRRPFGTANRQSMCSSPSSSESSSSSPVAKKPAPVSTSTMRGRKQLEKERQKAQRQALAQQRKDTKEQERLAKQRQKQRDKEERDSLRERGKQENRDRKMTAQQCTGKFSNREIALVIDPSLKQKEGNSLKETFEVFQETYPQVTESRGVDQGAIQFIRRDYIAGGATAALQAFDEMNEDGYQLCDRLLIVFSNPNDFLVLMERSDIEDDYPKLEEWLEKTNTAWKKKWNRTQNPRLVILLPGILQDVHRRWNAASRKERQSLMTDVDINDAIVWLHVAFRVECQSLSSFEDVLAFLLKMTRAISEEPYIQQVTELECVKKIKSQLPDAESATQVERANDTWIRMLQQVPRMSVTRAEHLAQFYPTARSLWQAYQSTSDNDGSQARLVTHLLGDKQYKKLSEQLSKVMTSNNPNELLS